VRLCQGGPDNGRIFHDLTREHFRSEYVLTDRMVDGAEVWEWKGEDAKMVTEREVLLSNLRNRISESQRSLVHQFGPAAFGVTSLNNQLAMLDALAYLVEHQSEQAWKSNPHVPAEVP